MNRFYLLLRLLIVAAVLWPASALAHGGHLAELAGHGHWVGIAAVLGAAVLGAAAAKIRGGQAADEDSQDNDAVQSGGPDTAEG